MNRIEKANVVSIGEKLKIEIDYKGYKGRGKIEVTREIRKEEEGDHYTFNTSFAKFLADVEGKMKGVTVIRAGGKGRITGFKCNNKTSFDQLMSKYMQVVQPQVQPQTPSLFSRIANAISSFGLFVFSVISIHEFFHEVTAGGRGSKHCKWRWC